jgi:hypothetical protein
MRTYYQAPLPPLHVLDGASFGTFTSFQSIAPTPPIIFPANILEVGSEVRLEFDGEFTCATGITLGLGFLYGATTLAVGTAIATGTTPTSWPCHAEWVGRVRAVGTAGSIQGAGWWAIGTGLTAFSTAQAMPVTLALRTVAIDTTAATAVSPGAVYGTSGAGNTIKVNRYSATLVS